MEVLGDVALDSSTLAADERSDEEFGADLRSPSHRPAHAHELADPVGSQSPYLLDARQAEKANEKIAIFPTADVFRIPYVGWVVFANKLSNLR